MDSAPGDGLSVGPSEHLRRQLRISMPRTEGLRDELFHDLDDELGGVGWWAPTTPLQYRIRIGDFLFQAQAAILGSILEATVSLEDLERLWREADGLWADHLKKNGPGPSSPAPHTDDDFRRHVREDSLLTSFFTAVGRVLDHVATVVVGAFDLPVDIVRADWSRLLKMDHPAHPAVVDAIDGAGPTGWLDWTLSLRNVLTHRPRQLSLKQMHLRGVGIYLPGTPHPADHVRMVLHLPSRPDLSFVEALRVSNDSKDMYLTEAASVTLSRTLRSVLVLAERSAEVCRAHWSQRRRDREPQANYAAQWRSQRPGERFPGFAPGSLPIEADMMMLAPEMEHRVRAAHLFDGQREQTWGFA